MENHGQLVAQFSKALDMDWLHTVEGAPWEKCCQGEWLVLGYFDILRIYDLPYQKNGRGWLNDIWFNNIKLSSLSDGTTYFHPLYLTADAGDFCGFWKENPENRPPYLLFTLLQGAVLQDEERGNILIGSEDLEKIIPKSSDSLTCACYHTMELSDMVVLWSSDNLAELLKALQKVYQNPVVGDITTFVAIDYKTLETGAWERFSGLDELVYISTEYVVHNAGDTQQYINRLKELFPSEVPLFSIGTEDVRLSRSKMNTRWLLEFLRAHITDQNLKSYYKRAFIESVTKLGICLEPVDVKADYSIALKQRYSGMLKCISTLAKDNANSGRYGFLKQLCNLLNVLVNMSQNCVLDGFCFLICEAVEMFCGNVEKLIRANDIGSDQLDRIHRFLRGLGTLMEQATRMDGRFIQLPGFSPILCEIPSHLLELYQCVSRQFAELLCTHEDSSNMAVLLLPKLCRRVKVYSIFENTDWQHKTIANPDDQLLYVDIPLDVLYDPALVLCCLGHEISHFVGNLWRDRQERYEYLLFSAAYELSQRLKMPGLAVMHAISGYLDGCLKDYGTYLETLEPALSCAVIELLREDEIFDNWRETYLSTSEGKALNQHQRRAWEIACGSARRRLQSWPQGVSFYFRNLFYLAKECFADLCMVCLIQPDRATYLRIAKQEIEQCQEQTQRPNSNDDAEWYQMFVERWGLVLSLDIWLDSPGGTTGEEKALAWLEKNLDDEQNGFKRDIQAFLRWLKGEGESCYGDDGVGLYHDHEIVRQTRIYLERCVKKVDEDLADATVKEKQGRLRRCFELLTKKEKSDWVECERLLFDSREKILCGKNKSDFEAN